MITVIIVRLLFTRDDDLNRLLYVTVTNEIEMNEHPDLDPWQRRAFTWTDLPRIMLIKQRTFLLPGKITWPAKSKISTDARTRADLLLR